MLFRRMMSRDSSVGIATRYMLNGLGLIPGIATFSRPTLGPAQPSIQWVPGAVYPGGKATGF
jgi:hypothetical protein